MDRWVRVAGVAGIVAGIAWAVKLLWLAVARVEGAVDTGFFFVGLAAFAVCVSGLAVALLGSRSTAVVLAGAIGGALLGVLLVPVASIASSAVFGEGTWAGGEMGVLTLGVLGVVAGVALLVREPIGTYRTV